MVRVAIVGGGVAGIATAWALARRGADDVVLVEREGRLGTQSSGRNAAVLRTLSETPLLSAFARRSAALLHDPPPELGPGPLVDGRGLVLGADERGAAELEAWFRGSDARGDGRELSPSEYRTLVPHAAEVPAFALAFPREGRIDVERLMAGLERGARAGGVRVRTGVAAEALLVAGGRVEGLRLSGGEELLAETTVVAAGAWACGLARAAGSSVELTPTRRHLLVTAPDARVDPRWPVLWHHGAAPFYARAERGGLLVCACDQTPVDPDRWAEDPAVRALLAERIARHLPAFAGAAAQDFWAGLRTFAPDHRFAIGPDPDLEGLHWAAALGGHGIVCAGGVGELAAELVLGLPPTDGEAARAFAPAHARAVG